MKQQQQPQEWLQAVRRMPWVRPQSKPVDKLESVKWQDEKQTGPPWRDLKAFTRDRKVWLKHMSSRKGFSGCAHTRLRESVL